MNRRWLGLVVLPVAGAVLAFAASFLLTPRYTSYATLFFPLAQSKSSSPLAGLAGDPSPGGTVSNFGGALVSPVVGGAPQTAIGILESYACRKAVMDKLELTKKWNLSEGKTSDRLAQRMTFGQDKNGFVRIEANLDEPRLSAAVVDAYYKTLGEMADKLSLNVSRKNREFIQIKVNNERKRIAGLEDQLSIELSQLTAGGVEGLGKLYLDTRAKLTDAEVEMGATKSALRSIDSNLQRLFAQAKNDPNALLLIEDLAGQLRSRRLALEDAQSKFAKSSPELQAKTDEFTSSQRVAKNLIDERDRARRTGTTPLIADTKTELQRLETKATGYASELRKLGEKLLREPHQTVKVERLQRQVSAGAQNLAKLEGELQLASIAEARDPSQFELVDPPRPADESTYPRRVLMAALAFIGVAFLQIASLAARKAKEQ